MSIKKDSLIYKLYRLSLPELWLDLFLPILLGAAISLNINSEFNIFYFIITAFAFLLFILSANCWIKYFFAVSDNSKKEVNLYQLLYYFYYNRRIKEKLIKKLKVDKKNLLLIAIITTLILIIFAILTIQINEYIILIIFLSILLFIIYVFLQIKMIDSFFDELIIGLLAGPCLVTISYMLQSGGFNISIIFLELPISLLAINLRWVSQHNRYYSFKGFKILLLFIYASFALVFAIFNNIIFLLLYISLPIVMYKLKKDQNILYYNSEFEIIDFSRKLYYYTSLLLAALIVFDYIIRI
ncbi:MAG: hypothetical protein ACOC1O_02925 [bacterium]